MTGNVIMPMRSTAYKRNILFLSHTNAVMNRQLEVINHYMKSTSVELIVWQRPDRSDNFDGIPTIRVRAPRGIVGLILFSGNAYAAARQNNYRLVYCSNLVLLPVAFLIARRSNAGVVFDSIEIMSMRIANKFTSWLGVRGATCIEAFLQLIENQIMRLADGILVIDSDRDDFLKRARRICSNTECIHNYPSLSHQASKNSIRKWFPQIGKRRSLAYAGGIFAAKGIDIYLDLAMQMANEVPDVLLVLVGMFRSKFNEDQLRHKIKDKGLNARVLVIPWQPYSALLGVLESCDVGLSLLDPQFYSYRHIGLGTSRKTFTYLQAGLPIVTSIPVIGEFVEQQRVGCHVNFGEVDTTCATIVRLLQDESQLSVMQNRARNLFESKYNWEQELLKIEHVFSEASIERT